MSEAGPDRTDRAAGDNPAMFLERQGYRRRRLMDAARLLPLLGALLFALPMLWPDPDSARSAGTDPVKMSDAIVYVFLVWLLLVAASLLFGISARNWGQSDSPHRPGERFAGGREAGPGRDTGAERR